MKRTPAQMIEQLERENAERASDGSVGDRVSIDRDALRVLCIAAGNLCRKRTDKRIAAVRAALNRIDADWEQYRQNDGGQYTVNDDVV